MRPFSRWAAHAAASALALASLSCSSAKDAPRPADLTGAWEGVVTVSAGATSTPSYSGLTLVQSGGRVTGTLGPTAMTNAAALRGTTDGGSLAFTLDFAGGCGMNVAGSGEVERLADRDRLHLRFEGTSTCDGAIAARGAFDRMRCPAPRSACPGSLAANLVPYCAELASDPANCGACGTRCAGALQTCARGACEVPACAGPAPLEAPRPFFAGDTLWALVLGDVDGDGASDAIASGAVLSAEVDSAIFVLRNDGHGALSRRTATSLASLFPGPGAPPNIPSAVAVGDLDGDGRLDVAAYVGALPYPDTVTTAGEVVTLLGNGDGSFRGGERLPTGADDSLMDLATRVIAVADLNGDGVDDVAARSGNARTVQVRLGRAGATLGPKLEYAIAEAVGAIAIADVDRDGSLDVVVASEGSSPGAVLNPVVSVLRGKSDGDFGLPVESPGVGSPQDLAVADLDGDGCPDLAIVGWWSWAPHPVPDVSVLLGSCDGSFRAPVAVEDAPVSFAWSVAVADLDGDWTPDLVVGDDERGLELFLGAGDGTFRPFETPVAGGAGLVAVADLDGDGRTDVIAGDEGGREDLAVYRACAP